MYLSFSALNPNISGEEEEEEEEVYEPVIVNEEEEGIFNKFVTSSAEPTRTLADMIMDKIREKETVLGKF